MPQGYKLTSRIKRADPDFIPSLIGMHKTRVTPSGEDQYFESVEITDYRPGCIKAIERTNMVVYDSLELGERDPIIKAYGDGVSFHTTISDGYRLADEEGDDLLKQMLDVLTGATRVPN